MPLDLLLSCWVFYWVYKIELMVGNIMGWQGLPRLSIYRRTEFRRVYWVIRGGVVDRKGTFHKIGTPSFSGAPSPSQLDDSQEPIRYRLAFACVVFGTIFLTVFSHKGGYAVMGNSTVFGIYFLLGTMIARLRAENGILVPRFSKRCRPTPMIINAFGTRRLGPGALTVFTLYMHFTFANRTNLMPQQLEAFKIRNGEILIPAISPSPS